MHHAARHRRSSSSSPSNRRQGSVPELILAIACAVCAVPGIVVLLVDQLPGTALVGLALLVPGAVLVGGERLSRRTGGPDIHDRQLDHIVAAAASTAAVSLIAVGAASGGRLLGSTLVLATPLLAIGCMALLFGTRRLWQLRAVPALLLAAWPVPWAAMLHPVEARLGSPSVTAAVAAATVAVLVVLVAAPRCTPSGGVRAHRARAHRAVSGRVEHVALFPPVLTVLAAHTRAPLPDQVVAMATASTEPLAVASPALAPPGPGPVTTAPVTTVTTLGRHQRRAMLRIVGPGGAMSSPRGHARASSTTGCASAEGAA